MVVTTSPYSPYTCAKEPFLVCILLSHLCRAWGNHPGPVFEVRGERPHAAPPVPSNDKDKSTVRSLWTTFPPNHCMLPYDKSSWSKLLGVHCCLGWFSPPAFALHHPTLRTTVQMFRAIWLACSQMESCPGVKMALEEGQDCPVTPFSHQTPALVAEGWDTRVSICVSAPLGSD